MPRVAKPKPPKPPLRAGCRNPRIDRDRALILALLAAFPDENSFSADDLAGWQAMGMGPRFYLYNGINAATRVSEDKLDKLDTEEKAWREARE